MNLKDLIVKYMKNSNNDDASNNSQNKSKIAKSVEKIQVNELDSKSKILLKNNALEIDLQQKNENKKNLKSSKLNKRIIDSKDFQNIIQRQVKSGKKLLDGEVVQNKNDQKNMV
jgi:hypothetical protein